MTAPARPQWRNLSSILLEAGVIAPDQVEAALTRQRATGLRFGETLVEMGAATEEDIGWALARQLELPFMDPHADALDRELIKSFPDGLLLRLDAVPLVLEDATLSVAVADPTDAEGLEELTQAAGQPLTLAVATPASIRRVLREVLGVRRPMPAPAPAPAPLATDRKFDVQWDRSGTTFLLFHVDAARRAGATEVHFLPSRGTLDVFHRIGGRLVAAGSEPPTTLYYLLARIDALGGPAIDDRQLHAAGSVVCPLGTQALRLGVSLLHQEHGISVTLTLRPMDLHRPSIETLGFDSQDLARLRGALDQPAGLGIVIGPTGSGGSTTLACLLAEIGTDGRRCIAFGTGAPLVNADVCVPAPVAEAAEGWARAVEAQNADIVLLDGVLEGDAVTGSLAAAGSGRWLLMRTDWADTFALLEHMAVRPRDRVALAERLRFVVHQRVVQTAVPAASAAGPGDGRRAVYEVLIAGDGLRAAIRAGESAPHLRGAAERDGFVPLGHRVASLITAGTITAGEAARVLT